MTRGLTAMTIITAINGAASDAVHHRAPVQRLDRIEGGEIQ